MLKRIAGIALCSTIGLAAGAAAGYVIGAVIGLVMTWYNNTYLTDAPHGSYLFWANLVGWVILVFTAPVGLIVGLVVGLVRCRTRMPEEVVEIN